MSITIAQTDLESLLTTHEGNRDFSRALEAIDGPERLIRTLAGYVHFNATFGAGVANLAGEIGVRQDLFRDPNEPLEVFADRSMDVAASIFAAAIDEFDDSATEHRDTHRSLAQATLKATISHFGFEDRAVELLAPLPTTVQAVIGMREGYGVGRRLEEAELFHALGFHMGSELLADEEFNLLDNFLSGKYPELVTHLEKTLVPINGEKHAAYFWIRIHTSVEEEHFAHAVKGVNNALQFYAGPRDRAAVKQDILDGVQAFATVQASFMAGLTGKTG